VPSKMYEFTHEMTHGYTVAYIQYFLGESLVSSLSKRVQRAAFKVRRLTQSTNYCIQK
jgi:hypothetical protein